MTNQQILTKAIQKAIDGGWSPIGLPKEAVISFDIYDDVIDFHFAERIKDYRRQVTETIFNHEFCKALWGEDLTHGFKGNTLGQIQQYHQPAWQYHLQQMVIAEDPIKYLGEHI